ncbi:MAG: flagellar basal body-associated FliL family protein [Cycloclasticus sp.]
MRLVVLLCGFLLFTSSVFAEEGDETEEAVPDIIYLPLTPQFTVNLLGNKHYLRTSIELQLANADIKEAITANDPAIRHALIVLLSNNYIENITSIEGRMELQDKAADVLNETLKKYAKMEGVDKVLFTDFVSQ